jgi:transcription-repair coupling factor (superfamily II helicase)
MKGDSHKLLFSELPAEEHLCQVLEALRAGEIVHLGGVPSPARPFIATLLALAGRLPVCVITPNARKQDYFHSELVALAPFFEWKLKPALLPELEWLQADTPPQGLADLESVAELLRTLQGLDHGSPTLPGIIVATEKAFTQPLPSSGELTHSTLRIVKGRQLEISQLVESLVNMGYEQEGQVTVRGQFARRGGILDLFPVQSESPIRVEFFGNQVDSLRSFDPSSQCSFSHLEEIEIVSMQFLGEKRNQSKNTLEDHLPQPYLRWSEPAEDHDAVTLELTRNPRASGVTKKVSFEIYAHDFLSTTLPDPIMLEKRHEVLVTHWRDWVDEGWNVFVCCNNEGEQRRLRELVEDPQMIEETHWRIAPLLRGFLWPEARLALLSDAEIFGRYQTVQMINLQKRLRRAQAKREAIDFRQFEEGDFVVHIRHGVARFRGVQAIEEGGTVHEVLTLEYKDGALLHVPVEHAHLVGKYVGVGKINPDLDELGGTRWTKTAAQAQKAIRDYAAMLLKIQAHRKTGNGFAFKADNEWQMEFEDSFLYEETPDQLTAIRDTKEDMESDKPMDRLICGDVGFGKTEVAIRAAFKAVMSGKQVAVLAPTTVLAQQHERTFKERMADYPVQIELVSRFRTKAQQRLSLKAAREGEADILIGTHRLLQPDVEFKDLGLLIVDEEQRFGVKHKELFKELFTNVDILTLSATPIPRTLYLSMMGAKDISTIDTPPPNRLPVETTIAPYDERLIRAALTRELNRGGQVYFLHNRVKTIQKMRDKIQSLAPGAQVEFGHGQMDEDELEAIMMRFVEGKTDVLVATTIIESGLDIPRANTIIIDRADRFGLADLYQLRGRVGRGQTKAYAYLLLPRHLMIEADARKRVSAIKQYSQLGAGFKIAMRDLEIRGAGNILGTEQSGHATAIGFDLYCQLLKESIARLKGEAPPPRIEVSISIDFLPLAPAAGAGGEEVGAFIPRDYIQESRLRIGAYRKLAEVSAPQELEALGTEWKDRFGRHPRPVRLLLQLGKIRLRAGALGVSSIEVEEGKLMIKKRGEFITLGGRFPRIDEKTRKGAVAEPEQKLTQLLHLMEKLASPPAGRHHKI